ncbi:MAG: hypothetical protein RJB01_639 [Actinomycetota bacterium]|jgi:protein-S-isoprenylcysteine O-methyltransferase Ste14
MKARSFTLTLSLLAIVALIGLMTNAMAVGLLSAASIAGLIATRAIGRRVIGVALGVMGLIATIAQWGDWRASLGAALVVLATATVVWAPNWPVLGRRFEGSSSRRRDDPWRALDDGVDPTAHEGG